MKRLLLLAPLAAATLPPPAPAAANEPLLVTVMDEVVVTATKTEEKRKEIANAVVVQDALDIAAAPAASLGAILANEPGIDWRTRGNYGGAAEEIHIRGMGGDGTLVVQDGVVLNSPSLGTADFSHIPLNRIERVEVVKGPGSLLYGSGAMGGTVSIIGKRPRRDGHVAEVAAGYGNEATYHLAAESGGFVLGDLGYYLTANRKETDGFRDNSDLRHTDVGLNLLFDHGEGLSLDLNLGYLDREYGVPGPQPPPGTQPYTLAGGTFYNDSAANLLDRGEDENLASSLVAGGQAATWLDWRLKGDATELTATNTSRYSFSGAGDHTEVTNTVAGLEGNLDLRPCSQAGLLMGSEYRTFDYDNVQQPLDTAGLPVPNALRRQTHQVYTQGTFAELRLRPVEPVSLLAGLRNETHSRFGHETVGRYGLVLNPLPDTAFKLNRGQHFKAPTMNDLFWPDDGAFNKGNPNLRPETGWHTDLTLEQEWLDGKVFATLSWFEWDITGKIAWAEDPTQPSPAGPWNYWTPANVNTYLARGWEMSAKVGPWQALNADVALTLLDAVEELAPGARRPARYTPDLQLKAGLSHYAAIGLTSTLIARFVGARPGFYQANTDLAPAVELASYWTVDLKLEQELAGRWKLAFSGTNLLDQGYDTYLAGFFDQTTFAYTQQPYPGAGRSLFVSLAFRW
ncbi:MAG: TonB-dependent receptor [Thermodesulfobacteriota bacterium]